MPKFVLGAIKKMIPVNCPSDFFLERQLRSSTEELSRE